MPDLLDNVASIVGTEAAAQSELTRKRGGRDACLSSSAAEKRWGERQKRMLFF